jgi:GINS complex protein
VPAALSQRVINALKADAKTVELRSQAQHFYNLGAKIMELFEGEEMVDVLTDVCGRNFPHETDVDLAFVEDIQGACCRDL